MEFRAYRDLYSYLHLHMVGVVMNVILKQFIVRFRSIGNAMYKGDVRVLRMLVTVVAIALASAFISSHYSVKYFSFCIADLSTLIKLANSYDCYA